MRRHSLNKGRRSTRAFRKLGLNCGYLIIVHNNNYCAKQTISLNKTSGASRMRARQGICVLRQGVLGHFRTLLDIFGAKGFSKTLFFECRGCIPPLPLDALLKTKQKHCLWWARPRSRPRWRLRLFYSSWYQNVLRSMSDVMKQPESEYNKPWWDRSIYSVFQVILRDTLVTATLVY